MALIGAGEAGLFGENRAGWAWWPGAVSLGAVFMGYGPLMAIVHRAVSPEGRSIQSIHRDACRGVRPIGYPFWFTIVGARGSRLNFGNTGSVSDRL